MWLNRWTAGNSPEEVDRYFAIGICIVEIRKKLLPTAGLNTYTNYEK